ncbi:MAG: hypothetical protein PHN79_06080 [Methanoregula sp.]|nr:hypothetical protein [Methanoregula sp.]
MTILNCAEIDTVPNAAIAIFDGKEFDSLTGRGGDDGIPLRKTPWGEIAYQLGGEKALKILWEHEGKDCSLRGRYPEIPAKRHSFSHPHGQTHELCHPYP